MKGFATRSSYLGWLGRAIAPVGQGPSRRVPATTDGRDLVLGYATGYGRAQVEAFVRSLRAVYPGDIALFISPDPALQTFLGEHRIEVRIVTDDGRWAPSAVVARFAAYATELASRPGVGDVLLTDVRDVIFQGAPFAQRSGTLEVFVEDEQHRLTDHQFQIKYLKALVGEVMTDAVRSSPSVCAGVILGPAAEVGRLCRLMLTLGAIPRSSVGGVFGIDQASLNVAVHYGLIDATIRDNFGRVATIGMSCEGLSASDGLILNPDGGVSPIVHQYDRHPDLMAQVRARWGTDTPDRVDVGGRNLSRLWNRLRTSALRRLPELR